MATYTKAEVFFLGDYGVEGEPIRKSRFYHITDIAALATFKAALEWADPNGFVNSKVTRYSYITTQDDGVAKPGADVDVDEIAVIVLRKTSDGTIHKYGLPGPNPAIFTLESAGKRMTAAKVAEFATLLNTASTGAVYVGLYGYKIEKK